MVIIHVMPMLIVLTPKEATTVHVPLDFLEMASTALVCFSANITTQLKKMMCTYDLFQTLMSV